MPNATFLSAAANFMNDAESQDAIQNPAFSDQRGLTITDGVAAEAPFGWTLSNSQVTLDPIHGLVLTLDPYGSATTNFGVLTEESFVQIDLTLPGLTTPLHVFTPDAFPKEVAIFADLMVGGTVLATQQFGNVTDGQDAWRTLIDMTSVDLSSYTIGTTPVSLRLRNGTDEKLSFDNISASGTQTANIVNSGYFELSNALEADQSVVIDNIVVTEPYSVITAVNVAPYLSFAVADDRVEWFLDAPKSAFKALADGDTLSVGFDLVITNADMTTSSVTIGITITGQNEAPIVSPLDATLMEDASFSGTLSATDPDDSDSFTFEINGGAAKGVISLDPDTGAFTYTPFAHANGTDSAEFAATDSNGARTVGVVTLDITPQNDAPALIDASVSPEAYELLKGQSFSLYLAPYNFEDPDGDGADMTLTFSGHAGKGRLLIDQAALTANNLTYDTTARTVTGAQSDLQTLITALGVFSYEDTSGQDVTISFGISDNGSGEGTNITVPLGQISLAITTDPQAVDATADGVEDVVVQGQLTAIEEDGDALTFALAPTGAPASGTVIIADNGTYTYTPNPDFYGTDRFEFTVTDGNTTSVGRVTVNLINTNDAPIVADELVLTDLDNAKSGRLDGARVGDAALVFALADGGAPRNGTLVVQSDGRYVYTPNPGFSGYDSFTFFGSAAGLADFRTGKVFVFADDDTPILGDIEVQTIASDGRRSGVIEAVDPNGDGLTFSIGEEDGPANGTLTLDADGAFTYTPDQGFVGTESFIVTVSDGAASSQKEVSLSVAGTLVDGILTGTQESEVLVGTSGDDRIAGLGSSTPEGDIISAGTGDDDILIAGQDGVGASINGGTGTDRIVLEPGAGETDLTGANFKGIEQVIGNGQGIRFDGALDLSSIPVVTNTGGISGGAGDDTLVGSALAEAFDGQDGHNQFRLVGSVLDYTVIVTGPRAAEITNTLHQTDTVSNVDVLVFDDFAYFIDGTDNAALTQPDALSLSADETITEDFSTFLNNDVDVDLDTMSITSFTAGDGLDVKMREGLVEISANESLASLAKDQTAETSFAYEVTSGTQTSTGTVAVTVTGVNDAPDAKADYAAADQYTKISDNVLANDSDPDQGAVLSVGGLVVGTAMRDGFLGTSAAGAKVRIYENGDYTYDPRGYFPELATGQVLEDSFTYTVIDAHGATDSATVTFTITGADAPQLGANQFADYARGGQVISSEDGLLADALGQTSGRITAVANSETLEIHELVDGAVVQRIAYRVEGSEGGTFIIDRDGAIRFDPGRDFDDLKGDQTRETEVSFTVRAPGGANIKGTTSVIVRASDLAPRIETTLTQASVPDLAAIGVAGQFDQLGGVDVIGELFNRLDGAVPFDLNALLDFDVIDIDTVFRASYSAENGIDLEVVDVTKNSDALISGLGEKLNPAAEFATNAFNTVYKLPITPVYFGPSFDLEFGVQANFGWDIDLPSLGKTAIFQPVSLDLLLPDAPVTAGETFLVNTGNYISEAPTSVVQTVGLGDIKVDAGFSITSAKVSNVGLEFGTKDFLGLEIDDVFDGGLKLKREFDLLEIFGDEDGATADYGITLSIRDVIDAVLSQDFAEFQSLVQAVIEDANKNTLQDLADFIMAGLELIAENAAERIDIGNGVELKPSDLIVLTDKIPFNEFDGFAEDGTGYFLLENTDGEEVEVTGTQLILARDNSDVRNAIEDIKTMLTEEGFQPIAGLKVFAEVPIGNIEEIEGFGGGDTAPKAGAQQIEVVQTTRLAGVSLDFEEMAPEIAKIAIDKVTEGALEAAKSQPYLIPVVIGASIGARTQLELAQQYQKTFEEGFTSQLKIQPFELVAAAINPFLEGINAVANFLNAIISNIPLVGSSLTLPTIPLLTREGLETAFDAVIDGMAGGLTATFSALANVAGDVLDFIADNPIFTTTADFLGALASFSVGSAGSAISAISGAAGKLADFVGLNISPITSILNSAADIAYRGADAANDLKSALQSLLNAASNLAMTGANEINSSINTFAGFVKDMAKGVDMQVRTEFDLFEMVLDAGIDLVQIAKFNPDDVEVTYTIDGLASTQVVGDPAQFFATGDPGDILDGKATYNFSGDVDYDYRLKLDIDPRVTLFGTKVEGDIKLGNNTQYDIDFDYAGVKTTRDFTLDDMADLDPTQLFDDALVEIPLGFLEEIAEAIADNIRDGLGGFVGQTSDLDYNELRLFELNDVEISKDQFTQISEAFEIEIGSNRPAPHLDLAFNENTDFAVAAETLLSGLTGSMARVNGSALNLGQLIEVMGGHLFVTPEGEVVYRDGEANNHLNVGDTKTDIIEYHVQNDDGSLSLLAARIVVNGVNDTPVAISDSATMLEDGALLFDPLANDEDIDDGATFTLVSVSADSGVATVSGNQLSFTPDADFVGEVLIDYVMADEHGAQSASTVTLTVQPVADDVRTEDDAATTTQNTPLILDVVDNDTEVDGETIRITAVTQPSRGVVTIVSDREIRFDPALQFNSLQEGETDTVTATVTVSDTTGADQIQTVTFTIEGTNDAPKITADAYVIDEDTVGVFEVLTNDYDPDTGDDIEIVSVTAGRNGTTEISESGAILYTPDENFHGDDLFYYTIADTHGVRTISEVDVSVLPRGEELREKTDGDDDFMVMDEADGVEVIFSGKLGMDRVLFDPFKGQVDLSDTEFSEIEQIDVNFGVIRVGDDRQIDLSSVGQVINSRGIISGGGNETIIGTEARDVISGGKGADHLMGLGGDDIFVLGLNEAMGDIIDGGAGYDRIRANFLSPTLDISGAILIDIEELNASGGYIDVDASGQLNLTGIQTIVNTLGLLGTLGDDTITGSQGHDLIHSKGGSDLLRGLDGDDRFLFDTLTAANTALHGGEGVDTFVVDLTGGVIDISGVTFESIEAIDGQQNGIAFRGAFDLNAFAVTDLASVHGGRGNDTLTSDHDQTYFHGGAGVDELIMSGSVFDHRISEGALGVAEVIKDDGRSLTVERVEAIRFDDYLWRLDDTGNGPVTAPEAFSINEDDFISAPAGFLTSNDRDLQDEPFDITSVDSDAFLTVSLDAGFVTVATDGDALDALAEGDSRDVTFTYTVTNLRGSTSTETVTITVVGQNDDPDAVEDHLETTEDASFAGNVLSNDTDVDDGAVMEVTGLDGGTFTRDGFTAQLASGATVAISQDGGFIYDPRGAFDTLVTGEAANDSFTYHIADGMGGSDSATVIISVTGANDAPISEGVTGSVVAREEMFVSDPDALLQHVSDVDGPDDAIALQGIANGTEIDGSTGGRFTLNADGSYSFDSGRDFDDLEFGETRDTSVDYQIVDGEGAVSTATLTITVTAPDTSPTLEGDLRFASLISEQQWAELETTRIEGSFDQLGSIDVTEELFARLDDATGFDINDLLDFTLIDINKRIDITSEGGVGVSVSVVDLDAPEGVLAEPLDDLLDGGLEIAETVADTFLPLDLGVVEATPTFDAQIGLDIELGWDVDIPTLGRTTIFQPVGLDFEIPDEVAAGEVFLINSDNLVSETPMVAFETIGLGALAVKAGFALPETSVKDIGFDIRTADFGPFKLAGLGQASVSLNREFTLEETLEKARELVIYAAETIISAAGSSVPLDVSELLSTLLSLDIGNLIEGLFNSDFDFDPILDAITEGDPEGILDEILSMISTLSAEGGAAHKDVNILGAMVSERDVYDMAIDAMFNDYDGFDTMGVGYFELTAESGDLVRVTRPDIEVVAAVRGVYDKVNKFKQIADSFGVSPVEGLEVSVGIPVGNAEEITEFGGDSNHTLITKPGGAHQIQMVQRTELISLDVDFQALQSGLMNTLLDLAAEGVASTGNAQAEAAINAMKAYVALSDELKTTVEEGVEFDMQLSPAALVTAMVNAMYDAVNLFGSAVDALVPGPDVFTKIQKIENQDSLDSLASALDIASGAASSAFAAIEPLIDVPVLILQTVHGLISSAFSTLGNAAVSGATLVGGSALSGINSAISALESAQNFSITIDLLFDSITIRPFSGLLSGPIGILEAMKTAIEAGVNAVTSLDGLVDDLSDAITSLLNADLSDIFDSVLGTLNEKLMQLAEGAEMIFSLGVTPMDIGFGADLAVTQIATFDPDEVAATYAFDGYEVATDVGTAVGFFAPDMPESDRLDGAVTYAFSGDVDYEYRLDVDIDPRFTLFGIDLNGEFALGKGDNRDAFDFGLDYALIKNGQADLSDLFSFFDEALLELPFDLIEDTVDQIADQIFDNLGVDLPFGGGVENGELVLFKVDDVELSEDQFTKITQDFQIDITEPEFLF